MSRKPKTTRYEIVQSGCSHFLKNGYSKTSPRMICDELDISTGNLTYYFPTKEHLLAELISLLGNFQWNLLHKEITQGIDPIFAVALELAAMAVICEEDELAIDFYIAAYTSELCLEIIRKGDILRAKEVFSEYCCDWDEDHFKEAEMLVSGIEYATLITKENYLSLEARTKAAITAILAIFCVPDSEINEIIKKVFASDYRKIGRQMLKHFIKYVEKSNKEAIEDLLNKKHSNF